ncbi:hypothetical protein CO651_21885 [Rhizobium phaseoli]|nr:hypothetical protein CO651_21885 [Rhizobium phaseoli]
MATFDVVAVGTRVGKPEEWRYARHSLDTFLARMSGREAIFDDAGSAKGDVFSNVVLVAFYAYDQDSAPSMPQPIVRLDTAGFVELEDGGISLGLPSDDSWHVSTLYLTPDAKPGVLKSFELRAHVPMALNGHYVAADDKNGDRFDSRVLLRVSAEQQAKPRSLWDKAKKSGSIPEPTPELDPVFDSLALTITTRSYNSGDTRPTVGASNSRLSNLGAGTYEGTLTDIPLWTAARLKQPTGAVKVVRRWGFRVGEFRGKTNIPRRMILRLECQPQKKLGALSFWRATETLLTGAAPDPHTIADTLKRPSYSQEQRLQDISASLAPGHPVRWIVAVRLESEDDPLELTNALLAGLSSTQQEVESAFRGVADGSQISALPALAGFAKAGASMHWQVVGQLLETRAWRRLVPSPKLKHPDDPHRGVFWNVIEPRMLDDYWADPTMAGDNLRATATAKFPGIMSVTGSILDQSITVTVTAPIRAYFDSADEVPCVRRPACQPAITARDDFESIDTGVRFGLHIASMPVKNDVIIGAFRLILGTDEVSPAATLKEQMCLIRPYSSSGTRLQQGVELALTLPVLGLMPEGQDPPIGATGTATRDRTRQLLADEVRPTPSDPLMFSKTDAAASRYELVVRETAARGRDHEVRLMLRSVSDDKTAAASGLILVIDPEPFRVIGVRYVEPRGAVSDEANEVAVWNAGGEGGLSWRVKDENQRVELLLPPQIIGEAMEKNRSDDPAGPPDIAPGKPAAARFGSPTVVVIDPTYADTGYREPGWNLRRILGFPGQRSPGARLRHLRTELMYGLTTRLVPQDDIWITEIGATLGVPPQKLAEPASTYGTKGRHLALVNAVIAAEKRRLSIEKLWAGKPDQPLRIEGGLTFALRYNRRLADGSLTQGGPATPFRWPVPGDIPSDLPLSPSQRALIKGTFAVSRDDRQSFPGGVPWAFESANILSEVYREPVSETGRIQDIHLSALGAWAGQRALFAEDKSVIDTEVTMGRLQRYKLERIGRIGALWHRAKHVIVYERTVVPPRQFYNRYPIGVQQDEHLGRPVLRKVEEYVELLQPVRRYPENGTSISAAGFLTGVEFKSKRIPVDSRWGADVRREGWAVPLWNTAFAQPELRSPAPGEKDNPDDPSLIYPKPQIRCLFAAADGGEVAIEIDEPEKLVFFTSTLAGEGGDNTDAWRPVREVDFVDLPVPVAGQLKPRSEQLTDAMLPPEPAHVPGYERLTLKLKVTQEAVALMHGRATDGPSATMRNVTIARSSPSAGNYASSARDAIIELNAFAANTRAEMDGAIGRVLGVLEGLDPKLNRPGSGNAKEIKAIVEEAFRKPLGIDVKVPPVAATLYDAIKGDGKQSIRDRLTVDANAEVTRLVNTARAVLNEAAVGIQRPIRAVEGVAVAASALLEGLKIPDSNDYYELPEDQRLDLIDTLRNVRERIWDAAIDVKADIRALGDQAKFDVSKVIVAAGGDIRAVGKNIREPLDSINTGLSQLLPALIAAGTTIDKAVVDATVKTKEGIVPFVAAVGVVRKKLDAGSNAHALSALVTVCGAIESTVDLAITTLSNLKEGDTIPSPVSGAIIKGLEYVIPFVKTLQATLNTLVSGIDAPGGALNVLRLEADHIINQALSILTEPDGVVDRLAEMLTDDTLMEFIVRAVVTLSQQVDGGDFSKWTIDALTAIGSLAKGAGALSRMLDTAVVDAQKSLNSIIDQLESAARAKVAAAVDVLFAAASAIEDFVRSALKDNFSDTVRAAFGLDQSEAIAKQVEAAAMAAIDSIQQTGDRYLEDVKAEIYARAADATRQIEGRGRQLLGSVQSSVAEALGRDPAALADQATRLAQEGSDVLRLIRAVGDPPKNDRLGLNRPEVAYVLKEVDKVVDITPAISLVNRVSDTLAAVDQAGKAIGDLMPGMGFRLPTCSFAENMMPDALKGLSVCKLIPNIAGLDLRGLLTRAGFPDLDDLEAVKITQGFDKTERRFWMKALIDVPFTAPVDILAFGPVTLAVDDARFFAESSMAAGPGGSTQKITGRITGDWRVVCSGQDIITFRRTGLYFDESGRLDFKIAPERVELADALEFLTNFLAVSGKGEGLVIEPLMRGSVPAGVAATLDLALPDLTLGAFAITSLSLHVMFGVAAIPEFEMMGEVSVAQRTAPFTLSVWILNGGGYLTQRMSFRPTSRPQPILAYTLDVGIVAGVGLGFNFGVVSGGVWLQVGCSIAMTWTTERGGNSTAVTVFILARGNVDVAGLVTANIMLLLEVSYDGPRMIGRGTLQLSFKISMFYTLRVNQRVEYTFIGKKSAGTESDDYAGAYA